MGLEKQKVTTTYFNTSAQVVGQPSLLILLMYFNAVWVVSYGSHDLFVCLFACLFVCLFVCLFACLLFWICCHDVFGVMLF